MSSTFTARGRFLCQNRDNPSSIYPEYSPNHFYQIYLFIFLFFNKIKFNFFFPNEWNNWSVHGAGLKVTVRILGAMIVCTFHPGASNRSWWMNSNTDTVTNILLIPSHICFKTQTLPYMCSSRLCVPVRVSKCWHRSVSFIRWISVCPEAALFLWGHTQTHKYTAVLIGLTRPRVHSTDHMSVLPCKCLCVCVHIKLTQGCCGLSRSMLLFK